MGWLNFPPGGGDDGGIGDPFVVFAENGIDLATAGPNIGLHIQAEADTEISIGQGSGTGTVVMLAGGHGLQIDEDGIAADGVSIVPPPSDGVVLRSSTLLGDDTSTTATDGVVTSAGDDTMLFLGTGGLFRLTNGHALYHADHSWAPAAGSGTDRHASVWVAEYVSGDNDSDPHGGSYEMNDGSLGPGGAWTGYTQVATILIPADATKADDCTITDTRKFV